MIKEKNLVILTGAGISAESGIPTFRDSKTGLWENHSVDEVATPKGFEEKPDLVHRFYNERRKKAASCNPNAAHIALAELEKQWEGGFLLITQNVDDLHERAGSKNICHMHGELNKLRCAHCGDVIDFFGVSSTMMVCDKCKSVGFMRPDVVWFGELPKWLNQIDVVLENTEIFVGIGTSGAVYPAAMFVEVVATNPKDTLTIDINPDPVGNTYFDETIKDNATIAVPALIKEYLSDEVVI